MLAGGVGPLGSTAAARTAETASAALDVLRKFISVDVHSHGGKTGITSKAPPNDDLANDMRAGSLAVACLADVPDGPILARDAEGALAAMRAPAPGELYKHHLDRLAWMDDMVADHGLRRALCAADLDAADQAGQPAIVADVEGLGFFDGKLERLEEANGGFVVYGPAGRMTEILAGRDLSTAWLGAARNISSAARASRITRPQRSVSGMRSSRR